MCLWRITGKVSVLVSGSRADNCRSQLHGATRETLKFIAERVSQNEPVRSYILSSSFISPADIFFLAEDSLLLSDAVINLIVIKQRLKPLSNKGEHRQLLWHGEMQTNLTLLCFRMIHIFDITNSFRNLLILCRSSKIRVVHIVGDGRQGYLK